MMIEYYSFSLMKKRLPCRDFRKLPLISECVVGISETLSKIFFALSVLPKAFPKINLRRRNFRSLTNY